MRGGAGETGQGQTKKSFECLLPSVLQHPGTVSDDTVHPEEIIHVFCPSTGEFHCRRDSCYHL